MTYEIYPLDLGELQLDASFVTWQTNCGKTIWIPAYAYLVLGGENPILVDTGFRSVEDALANQGLTCRRSDAQTLEAQLARHSLTCEDVAFIVHTHLHMDHAGQDFRFSKATILLPRAELQNAAAPNMYPAPFYDRLNIARLVHDLWPQVRFTGRNEEIFPGIRLFPTPGHTPAHQSIEVAISSGKAVIAGDAVMNLKSNLEGGVPPGIMDDMTDVMDSMRTLKTMRGPVLPTHDYACVEQFPMGIR